MANTVTTLSYANTFGQWLAATDALIAENNVLAKDNYVKDSGTIYLSEGTLNALQSNGNVIVQKVLSVQGVGSYATIQNDLTVQRQGLFTNTGLSIAASGSVNVANVLTVSGSGYGLRVVNDAQVGGDLYVGGDLELNVLEARQKVNTETLSVTQTTYTNKLQSNNQIVTGVLTANSDIYTSRIQANTLVTTTAIQANTIVNAAAFSATTGIYGNLLQANSSVNTANASITGTTYTKYLQANASINTANASITGTTYTDRLIANTDVATVDAHITNNAYVNQNLYINYSAYVTDFYSSNTMYGDKFYANTLYIQNNIVTVGNTNSTSFFASANLTSPSIHSNQTFGDYLTANVRIYTPAIDVEGTTLTRFLQANSSTNTSNSSVVNTSWTKFLVANTLVTTAGLAVTGKTHTNTLQANTSANTESLSVTQRALVGQLQANTSVNTEILSVSTTALVNKLQANSSVNTEVISVTGNTYTDRVQANSSVNTAILSVTQTINANDASAFVHDLQVLNQLSIDGNFVINGETVYNSNVFTLNAGSNNAEISSIIINRGITGANAELRWNETSKVFDVLDVNNSNYYRLLTDKQLSDSVTSTNPLTVASSNAANILSNSIQTANTQLSSRIDSSASFANGAFVRANSSYTAQNTTATFANAAFRHANAAYESANNVAPQVAPAFNQANAAFDKANTVVASIKGTTGSVSANNAGVTFKSNNGIVIFATNDNGSGNVLSISTSQDLRTTGSPTFAALSLTTPLQVGQGGTGTTSHASLFGLAITAAAGSGAAGKVLGTDGSGNYSWVTGGSGGGGSGAQPGSRISSSRLTYTGDSSNTKFTTPTFSVGTQLRPYINGVRQLDSEYSANAANSTIIFNTPPVTGDKVLIEVDGYAIYEYYANNIAYGPASGDMVGTTIQSAIDNLETRKMPKIGGTFTGRVDGLTMPTTTSNTVFATTQFVTQFANAGYTLTHSITGNAGSVTDGLYSSGSYDNPTWITKIANTKITGTIADTQLVDAGPDANTYTYGTANVIPKITVDRKGRITGVTNTTIQITTSQITGYPTFATSATTDTTSATNITSGTLPNARLSDSGVTAASYGGSNKVATFTVDAKGRLTAASDQQISITKSQISDFPTITDTTNATNITSGTLAEARLPSGLAKLSGAAFTGDTTVAAATGTSNGKIILAGSGDITAYRDGTTTGVIYLNKAQNRYLYNDGSKYYLNGQGLSVNGADVLNTSDSFTITGTRNYRSQSGVGTGSQSGTLVCYGDNGAIGTNHATMSFHRPGSYAINMGLDNDNVFRIGGWSDNGVGTTAVYRMTLDSSGNAVFKNNVTAYSDVRLKTNIETIQNALDTVSKMRGVTYKRIDSGEKGIGVIAQEMKEVLPEVVMEAASEDEFMSVSYGNIVGVLIEAIKELKAEIEELKGQIK
jgi:hypothetical protein